MGVQCVLHSRVANKFQAHDAGVLTKAGDECLFSLWSLGDAFNSMSLFWRLLEKQPSSYRITNSLLPTSAALYTMCLHILTNLRCSTSVFPFPHDVIRYPGDLSQTLYFTRIVMNDVTPFWAKMDTDEILLIQRLLMEPILIPLSSLLIPISTGNLFSLRIKSPERTEPFYSLNTVQNNCLITSEQ